MVVPYPFFANSRFVLLLLYILPIVIMDPDQFCLQNDEQKLPYELTFRKYRICKVRHGIWWLFVEMMIKRKAELCKNIARS